jgi:predicted nucleic acid-binding Zn ribbon protein
MPFEPPGDCPVCGEAVPAGRKSCPNCGANARSGWSDETHGDGLDLPTPDFDYQDYVRKEFGRGSRRARPTLFWWIVGVVMVIVIGWVLVVGRW